MRPAAELATAVLAFRSTQEAWTSRRDRSAVRHALHGACLDLSQTLRVLRPAAVRLATGPSESTAWTVLCWLDPVAVRFEAPSLLSSDDERVAA